MDKLELETYQYVETIGNQGHLARDAKLLHYKNKI